MGSACSTDSPASVIEVDKRELDLLLTRFQLIEANQRKHAREQAVVCAKLQHNVAILASELILISEVARELVMQTPSPALA